MAYRQLLSHPIYDYNMDKQLDTTIHEQPSTAMIVLNFDLNNVQRHYCHYDEGQGPCRIIDVPLEAGRGRGLRSSIAVSWDEFFETTSDHYEKAWAGVLRLAVEWKVPYKYMLSVLVEIIVRCGRHMNDVLHRRDSSLRTIRFYVRIKRVVALVANLDHHHETLGHLAGAVNRIHGEQNCAICLEGFGEGIRDLWELQCLHLFHGTCILQWLQKSPSCPLCRYVLPPGSF
ncbi:hypothetical protein Dimus_023921 [Dionaea muscipula]